MSIKIMENRIRYFVSFYLTGGRGIFGTHRKFIVLFCEKRKKIVVDYFCKKASS